MSEDDGEGAWVRPSQAGADLVVALALLAIGLVFLVATRPLALGTLDAPGPGMFPGLVSAALILVSLGMIARGLPRPGRDRGPPVPLGHAHSALAALTLLAAALAFESVGFPLACFVLVFVLVKALARGGMLSALLFAAAVSAFTYLIFARGFAINLPLGVIFGG